MKSVLISIQPKWVEKIASVKKTIEVRKTRPKIETPFKCYIYCTYGKENENYMLGKRGKVIGEFVCDKVYLIKNRGFCFSVATEGESITDEIARQSCLDYDDMVNYLGDKDGYGWHISDLKIYDKPKVLSEFTKYMDCKNTYDCCACHNWDRLNLKCIAMNNEVKRPPQSWCYVESLGE